MTAPQDLWLTVARGRNAGRVGQARYLMANSMDMVFADGGRDPSATILVSSLTRKSQRDLAASRAGVTWAWLREELSAAEAEAWLGMDDS